MYFTYIIRCKDNTLYTGYTSDIKRRVEEHKKGINCKYTRARGFEKLEVYFETNTKSKAMKLESYIKKLTKSKKIIIIQNPHCFIKEIDLENDYVVGS
ncbi:GIY-YIG nuclease family protein [Romboutsia sp.]|uniref:GIY-YIG nuclease family protein n=1 Tax=Romboutsia sp. TaxID=1965302 RepID=UPI003F36A342